MKVEGISNYYAFMYNKSTGKIISDSEPDDGFADFYNQGGNAGDGRTDPAYSARKAGIDSLTRFFSTPGTEENFFNQEHGNDECTIIEEKASGKETRYYVDGRLMFTSMAGDVTANIKFAPGIIEGASAGEEMEFNDVARISVSDISTEDLEEEEHANPKRKSGTYYSVVVYPDGSRWLITTMYLCGKEIKIVKRLPPIDPEEDEEDDLLRQDSEDEEDKPGIADTGKLGINQSIMDVIQSYMEEDNGLDKDSLLFGDEDKDKR